MIAYGCVVSEPEAYRRYCEPGIARVRESDSRVYPCASVGTIGRSCNLLLASAAQNDDLEALVLLHPHAEIVDPDFPGAVRAGLADPEVGLLGVAGAAGVRSIAWWEGAVSRAAVRQRFTAFGGGELTAWEWTAPAPPPATVDALDEFLLVLSPWAVRHVAFDEGLWHGFGFAVDYCLQMCAAGRTVRTLDTAIVEHRELDLIADPELWTESHIALARKWSGRWPGGPEPPGSEAQWRRRARRAEAEREVARTVAYSHRLADDLRLDALEARLQALAATRSWRLTRPLRELNRRRRERAASR